MALPQQQVHRVPAFALRLCAILAVLAGTPGFAANEILTLGRISDDPKSHYGQLKPLLDYIVPRMRDVGIREGRILMARDLKQMVSHLRHGRVDWITETAGMAIQLDAIAGAKPLLLTERNGVREYRSYLVTRKDSGIHAIKDLAGRTLALEHVSSTSAYLVPSDEILAHGLALEPLMNLSDHPTGGRVGYLFARSEANISIWVDKGLIDAGAISNLGWANPATVPESIRGKLAVIHESEPLPRALELVRGDLSPVVAMRLKQLLLAASIDPEAAPALRRFFNTTAFAEIDHDVTQKLRTLRIGMARVRAEVE
jgi:phosphonate transport system substrate-binding protein